MKSRGFVIGIAVLAALIVGAGAALLMPVFKGDDRAATGQALVGGPFELVDQDGNVRRDTDFRDRYMLVYFGYNYCPDVCPTSLFNMTAALESLDQGDAEQILPIYITVDPERDTVEEMKEYAGHFHPSLVALTGSADKIADVARAYRVYYAKAGEDEDYLMDHSSFIYLMGPDGQYVRHFSHNTTVEDMTSGLKEEL